MTTTSIVKQLNKLPLTDRLLVIEKVLKSIRQDSNENLDHAVSALYNDYKTDKELTIFTDLNNESVYEAK